MEIRVGYSIEIVTYHPTPALLLLDPHPSRDGDRMNQAEAPEWPR